LVRPSTEAASVAGGAWLRVEDALFTGLAAGSTIELTDLRGEKRRLRVVATGAEDATAEAPRTCYFGPGVALRVQETSAAGRVLDTPRRERPLLLNAGDELTLRRDVLPATQATEIREGRPMRTGSIGCTLPEALDEIAVGHRVWLDDGKIGGVVRAIAPEGLRIEMTDAPPAGEPPEKLRADKGINFPDSPLRIRAMSEKDERDLEFIARHADMVGMSFVQRPADVDALLARVEAMGPRRIGVVLKIETAEAFARLPELLLAALRAPTAGVMIARGDLAVEMGYERLAEVQEEILWLCEAAHVPVIWATQVLETLAKTGRPTRAEVTDAAMGERAECVMLNKGPYILAAVKTLDSILRRMEAHQFKKSPLLRPLGVARRGE
jgi:pyruvate kinase